MDETISESFDDYTHTREEVDKINEPVIEELKKNGKEMTRKQKCSVDEINNDIQSFLNKLLSDPSFLDKKLEIVDNLQTKRYLMRIIMKLIIKIVKLTLNIVNMMIKWIINILIV